ncbi:MAG: hypothetical protein EU530_11670 [Promethearchaeota archaeon]|nr:MAG: hypothetical protein EU530_11670 [Candidatus Lokiarchaeota archaeon]
METFEIDGKMLYLAFSDELKIPWIGDKQYVTQIHAAWTHELDSKKKVYSPFNPKILGRCGMGKTTLAYSAAKFFHPNSPSEVFIQHCSDTLSLDQLLVHTIDTEKGFEYHASPLVTAMIKGAMCILDECQYLPSESWAAITTLLDERYVTSDLVGLKIYAHENFRLCVTESYFEKPNKKYTIPEYVSISLKPVININHPGRKHELDVLTYFFPEVNPRLLHHMVDFLQSAHFEERSYSIRDCINIIQSYETSVKSPQQGEDIDWNLVYQSIRHILDNQAIYFLNELLNQSNDSDFLFKDGDLDFSEDALDENSDNMNDFFEDEENYAEFIEEDDFDDFDDSFAIFDDKIEPEKSDDVTDSTLSDANYVKKMQKKIQSKLKKKKDAEKTRK